jgi:hypothetical protein
MRVRYQRGYLRLGQRKKGPDRWEFLWWDTEPSGVLVRRKAVIGTIPQYPNLENAWQASYGLRASINETRNRQAVGDVRGGNVKRVASAVGEGSIAIPFVHQVQQVLKE